MRKHCRNILAPLALAFLLATGLPHSAFARGGGDDHGGRSDDSHSGDSHSGRDSDDSGHGRGRDGDKSDDDKGGDAKDDKGRSGSNSESRGRAYEGGWRAQIRRGRYEVFDPEGRLVISRKAKPADYGKF